jgi:hypothetical protein
LDVRLGGQGGACPIENFQSAPLFGCLLLGSFCSRAITEYLYVAGYLTRRITDRTHFTSGPKAITAFFQPPTFSAAAVPMGRRVANLAGDLLGILEQPLQSLAEHFCVRPAEQSARAFVPTGYPACTIGADDRRVGRALNDLTPFGGFDRSGSGSKFGTFHSAFPMTNSQLARGWGKTKSQARLAWALVSGHSYMPVFHRWREITSARAAGARPLARRI